MDSLIIAVLASLVVYAIIHALLARLTANNSSTEHTRDAVKQMRQEASSAIAMEDEMSRSVMRRHAKDLGGISRFFYLLPGTQHVYLGLVRSGMQEKSDLFILANIVIFIAAFFFTRNFGTFAIPASMAITFALSYFFLSRQIMKRRKAMIDSLPDVLEMIVRSVRAGYPLNTVITIVAENMQPPISQEFKQVADEMAHGSSMIEALQRMAHRIGEPDFMFFVVVLSVQQEVGGNLAEVLGNLARLIRRRKNLRLKILALSGEGRATMWVLGSLPVFLTLLMNYIAPQHLEPLFETDLGNTILALAIGMVASGVLIVRKMVNIKV